MCKRFVVLEFAFGSQYQKCIDKQHESSMITVPPMNPNAKKRRLGMKVAEVDVVQKFEVAVCSR